MSLEKEKGKHSLFLSIFKRLFVKLKLESELLEEPLVFAGLVPGREEIQLEWQRA